MRKILAAAMLSLVTALSGFTPAAQAQSMANTVPSGDVRWQQHRGGGDRGWGGHRGPGYYHGGYYRDRSYGGRYYGDRYYRRGPSAGAIIGGLAAGAIIGGALAAPRYHSAPRRYVAGDSHTSWCYSRYRSYRAYDNTYQPNYGPRRQCVSP